LLTVLAITLGYWWQLKSGKDPAGWAIHPRDYQQWWGIFTSAFVHGSLSHLFSNIIALIGLLLLLFFFYDKVAAWILAGSWLLTGSFMFFFARPQFYHLGASGVAYAITFYLLFTGILTKQPNLRIISLIVAIYYGSMVWGLFPLDPKVSWDGHVAGAAAGLLMAMASYRKFKQEKIVFEDIEPDEPDIYEPFGN
jgi:membrane associated rhomboid family serine protease